MLLQTDAKAPIGPGAHTGDGGNGGAFLPMRRNRAWSVPPWVVDIDEISLPNLGPHHGM